MCRTLLCLVALSVVVSVCQADDILQFAPKWQVGEQWSVRGWNLLVGPDPTNHGQLVMKDGRPYEIKFVVDGVRTVGTQECFVVRYGQANASLDKQDKHFAYFAKGTCLLLRIEDASRVPGSAPIKIPANDLTKTEMRPMIGDFAHSGPVVLDTPIFTWPTGSVDRASEECDVRQTAVITDKLGTELRTRIITRWHIESEKERVVEQEWVRGLPWWRKCVVLKEGRVDRHWELISNNATSNQNSKVVASPSE